MKNCTSYLETIINDEITVCYDKFCVYANGKNAESITDATVFLIICASIAFIINAID